MPRATPVGSQTNLLPNHSQPYALQLPRVKPSYLLAEPGLAAGEFVLLGGGGEVAGGEQVGYRGLAILGEVFGEPASARRGGQNDGLAGKVGEFADVFLGFGERVGPAIRLAEQGNGRIQIVDAQYDILDAIDGRSLYAG